MWVLVPFKMINKRRLFTSCNCAYFLIYIGPKLKPSLSQHWRKMVSPTETIDPDFPLLHLAKLHDDFQRTKSNFGQEARGICRYSETREHLSPHYILRVGHIRW